jgi:hypothetical protein
MFIVLLSHFELIHQFRKSFLVNFCVLPFVAEVAISPYMYLKSSAVFKNGYIVPDEGPNPVRKLAHESYDFLDIACMVVSPTATLSKLGNIKKKLVILLLIFDFFDHPKIKPVYALKPCKQV